MNEEDVVFPSPTFCFASLSFFLSFSFIFFFFFFPFSFYPIHFIFLFCSTNFQKDVGDSVPSKEPGACAGGCAGGWTGNGRMSRRIIEVDHPNELGRVKARRRGQVMAWRVMNKWNYNLSLWVLVRVLDGYWYGPHNRITQHRIHKLTTPATRR